MEVMGHRSGSLARRGSALVLFAALAAFGCGRVVYFNAVGDGHDGGPADGAPAGDGSSSVPDAGQADVGAGDAAVDPSCGSPRAPFAPMRRLTRFEYDNTLRDLVGDLVHPSAVLPPFSDGDSETTGVSVVVVEGYHTIAHDIALKVVRDPIPVRQLTRCYVAVRSE